MRSFLAVLAFVFFAGNCNAQTTIMPTWAKANEVYVNTGPSRQYIGPVFASTCQWNGSSCGLPTPPQDVFQTLDLAAWGVGSDATAVFLSGILIITSGTTSEVADLGVIFRAPGDVRVTCVPANYTGQTVFQMSGTPGGQRSNMATWVPVINGKIEWCWHRSTPNTWPVNASYGVNLAVQAWVR